VIYHSDAPASAARLKWFDAFSNSEKRPRCSAGGGSGITSIGDNAYCDLEQVELSEDGYAVQYEPITQLR
jgi:hypothetical protein